MIGGIAKIARLPICYTVIERIFPFRGSPAPPLAPMLALVPGGLGCSRAATAPPPPGAADAASHQPPGWHELAFLNASRCQQTVVSRFVTAA